jgi:dolichyl-phosphate-mannose--protein O-mannosyl transferase
MRRHNSWTTRFIGLISWHDAALIGIILFAVGTRLVGLGSPDSYYFDEVYHGVTAKAYAANDPRGYEWWHKAPEPGTAFEWLHPPLGKVFMALGYRFLGESAWAWRVPGALVGSGLIGLIYALAVVLTKNKKVGLTAAGLAALDGLLLAQSRIGMNDIYLTFFFVATLFAYAVAVDYPQKDRRHSRWLWVSGIMAGLAIATKWSGVFVIGAVGFLEILRLSGGLVRIMKRIVRLGITFVLVPMVVYVLSYSQFWIQGHTIQQFFDLHRQIWWYQTHLEATHQYQSSAWEWPLMLKPVWYHVDYSHQNEVVNIYNLGNPLLLWIGLALIIVSVARIIWHSQDKRRITYALLLLLVGYFFAWVPWLFSPRIMFFYHYAPAIPFLCIITAFWLMEWWNGGLFEKLLATLCVISIGFAFIWFVPIWIGIPLPTALWDHYFWLASWK